MRGGPCEVTCVTHTLSSLRSPLVYAACTVADHDTEAEVSLHVGSSGLAASVLWCLGEGVR